MSKTVNQAGQALADAHREYKKDSDDYEHINRAWSDLIIALGGDPSVMTKLVGAGLAGYAIGLLAARME